MASTETIHRTVDGVELPEPGTWTVDPAHSSIEAVARHLMMSKVRGRFHEFNGVVHIEESPEKSWADATIATESIDTASPDRDAHLRSGDFLAADDYPEMTFRSTRVAHAGGNRFKVDGDLTIRGVTNPIELDVELAGLAVDPWGNKRALLSASGRIDREAYGMTWNQALESGGVLLGKHLTIEIEAQLVKQ